MNEEKAQAMSMSELQDLIVYYKDNLTEEQYHPEQSKAQNRTNDRRSCGVYILG